MLVVGMPKQAITIFFVDTPVVKNNNSDNPSTTISGGSNPIQRDIEQGVYS